MSFGLPDLIGYHNSSGFFMVELKIQTGNKIRFSPHQILFHTIRTNRNFIVVEQARQGGLKDIKLYGSKSIEALIHDPRAVDPLDVNDFEKIQKILIS